MDYYTWIKGDDRPLTTKFRTTEFTCQCKFSDCINQKISVDLVNNLTNLRNDCGFPIKITSGYRCQKHQEELSAGGLETAKNSQHVLGNAADVSGQDVEKIFTESEKYFQARGKAKFFVHLDLRSDKTRLWYYTKS